jgi:hypothetical protein
MPVLIICAGNAMGPMNINPRAPEYLKSYDPDGRRGFGDIAWTFSKDKAKRFPDMSAAWAEWKRTSTVRPTRDDGRPNRPLTAYHVTFATVEG